MITRATNNAETLAHIWANLGKTEVYGSRGQRDLVSITSHQTIIKANSTSIMAWTFVATRGIIRKTLPSPRKSSSIDVEVRAGKDKSGTRYRDNGYDATMHDAVCMYV